MNKASKMCLDELHSVLEQDETLDDDQADTAQALLDLLGSVLEDGGPADKVASEAMKAFEAHKALAKIALDDEDAPLSEHVLAAGQLYEDLLKFSIGR